MDLARLAIVNAEAIRDVVPVWLVDVDGVLNVSKPGWGGPPHHGTVAYGAETYQMRWAPRLITELARFHRTRAVEFRWATTWADHIDQVQNVMRLPRIPTAFSGPTYSRMKGRPSAWRW